MDTIENRLIKLCDSNKELATKLTPLIIDWRSNRGKIINLISDTNSQDLIIDIVYED